MRWLLVVLALAGCAGSAESEGQKDPNRQPAAAQAPRVVRSFPLAGVTKVILRAGAAESATVATDAGVKNVEVSGLPNGGASGYKSPNPGWRETPAGEWGLDFVSARFGPVLVISTQNEMQFMHHGYSLSGLVMKVPPGITVVRQTRHLSGDGKPDLSDPATAPSISP